MGVRLTIIDPSYVKPNWSAPNLVKAVSTTRLGGVSKGAYESLNLGMHVQDKPEHVIENRSLTVTALKLPSEPVWLKQVHGVDIITLNDQTYLSSPVADGIVTQQTGRVLCIMTADCLPILFTNTQGTEVAAVHAGWRSMAGGIIERVIAQMVSPASEIIAWGGPCIGADAFEVGQEVVDQLGGSASAYKASQAVGKFYANLHQLAAERLSDIGVHTYSHSNACTYNDSQNFFSYRRSMQSSNVDCGRMATFIWL